MPQECRFARRQRNCTSLPHLPDYRNMGIVAGVFLPLVLLLLAAIASAIAAYGTHPVWAQYPHGLNLILFARYFLWPLGTLALLLCLALVALVVSGKRRVWWLIGLGPILALFIHRFATDPLSQFAIADNPAFVQAADAAFLADDDYVIGLTFNGVSYAYPAYVLYRTPVVFQQEHSSRMILMWSAFGNRAVAYGIKHDLRARDVEIVSMPANAILLYNSRLGEFINGLTGQTVRGQKPTGFLSAMATSKTNWREWRANHPATLAMVPAGGAGQKIPNAPLRPWYPMPRLKDTQLPAETRVNLINTPHPVAVIAAEVPAKPIQIVVDQVPVLLFRDPSGRLHVFDRRIDDLTPKFRLNKDLRRKQAWLIDLDTNSGWSPDGRAVDGPMAKAEKRLVPIAVEDGLYWGLMKTWMPQLEILHPALP
jgi:hypothetical protein